MARMPLAERRQQLVDAAIAVMTREGVNAATTRAIVAEAGTSLSVFHYCFDSKQELLDAVLRSLVGSTVTLAEESFEDATERGELIRAGLRAYWEHVVAHPDEHLLTYELTQYCLRTPGYADVARQQYDHYAHTFCAVLETLGLRTAVPMPVVARFLAVTVDGLTLDWLARRDDEGTLALLDQLAGYLEEVLEP